MCKSHAHRPTWKRGEIKLYNKKFALLGKNHTFAFAIFRHETKGSFLPVPDSLDAAQPDSLFYREYAMVRQGNIATPSALCVLDGDDT
jgi:hypothetical protein